MKAAVTVHTEEITGRNLGKWAQPDVPRKGWRCIGMIDYGEPDHVCEMCEWQEVRYVHWMQHDDYPSVLKVGCDCAGRMEESYKDAADRDRRMRKRARKRENWLNRKWRVSYKGNPCLKANGRRVTVWRKGAGWSFTVAGEDAEAHHDDAIFSTPDEAKLAAFDFMWPAEVRVSPTTWADVAA